MNGPIRIAGISTSPDAQLQPHGCLGIVLPAVGGIVGKSSNYHAVQRPLNSLGRPVHCVDVRHRLRVLDRCHAATIIDRSVAFAEVVGLDLVGSSAEPLPVDLVEVVRLQHHCCDDASPIGSTNASFCTAKEKVPRRLQRGVVTLFQDRNLCPGFGEVDRTGAGVLPVGGIRAFDEVDRVGCGGESCFGGALP